MFVCVCVYVCVLLCLCVCAKSAGVRGGRGRGLEGGKDGGRAVWSVVNRCVVESRLLLLLPRYIAAPADLRDSGILGSLGHWILYGFWMRIPPLTDGF